MLDNVRRCDSCGSLLTQTSRRDRRYCSPACRQAAYERRRRLRVVNGATPAGAIADELRAALARATDESRLLARVAAHAHAGEATSWRSAARLLERMHPSVGEQSADRVTCACPPSGRASPTRSQRPMSWRNVAVGGGTAPRPYPHGMGHTLRAALRRGRSATFGSAAPGARWLGLVRPSADNEAEREAPAKQAPVISQGARGLPPILPALRRRLIEHRLASPWTRPGDPVFASTSGRPKAYRNVRRALDAIAATLDLDLTSHDFRRSLASYLIVAAHADAAAVTGILAHADIETTRRIYAADWREVEERNDLVLAQLAEAGIGQ